MPALCDTPRREADTWSVRRPGVPFQESAEARQQPPRSPSRRRRPAAMTYPTPDRVWARARRRSACLPPQGASGRSCPGAGPAASALPWSTPSRCRTWCSPSRAATPKTTSTPGYGCRPKTTAAQARTDLEASGAAARRNGQATEQRMARGPDDRAHLARLLASLVSGRAAAALAVLLVDRCRRRPLFEARHGLRDLQERASCPRLDPLA